MQGTPPAQDKPNSVSMQDSVITEDIVSSITYQQKNQSGPKTLQWINFSLICLILVMVSISIFSDSWVVEKNEINIFGTTGTIETSMGLDDIETTTCSDGTCEFEEKDIKESYEECMNDANESSIFGDDIVKDMEEYCAITDEKSTAGFVGTIVFSISIVLLLVSGILLALGIFGKNIPYANYSPAIPGVLIFLGFILWRLLLPPFNGDYGWGAKLTLFSGVLACYVSANPLLDNIHTSNGLTSFLSDQKLEMMKKLNLVWFGLTVFGFMLLFFIPVIGLPMMLFSLLFSFINFSDPKLISEQNEHGEQRMLLLQFGRNHGKPVEEAASPAPTAPTPTAPTPTAPTPTAPTPTAPTPTAPTPTPPAPEPPTSQETVEEVDWPEVAPEPEAPTKEEEIVDEPTTEAPIVQEEVESEPDVASATIESPTPTPSEPTLPEPEPPTKEEVVVGELAPEVPITQEEVESEPDVGPATIEPPTPTPELMIPPAPAPPTNPLPPAHQAAPPPMAQMPSPPQMSAPTNLPPPPIAPMPPPMAQMPPPPNVGLPPPPSAGLPPPLPLPPQGENPMAPNPFVTQRPKEPRSFSVQAAPRDDLMSSEEADDLLHDLND